MEYRHIPVMLKEVLEILNPQKGDLCIDGTLGGGGYTFAIAERISIQGKILSIDLDKLAIENTKNKIEKTNTKNIILINDNFKNIYKIAENHFNKKPDNQFSGIVFDLGLSSAQLEDSTRGFSFQSDTPIDMAFASENAGGLTTTEIINEWPSERISRIIKEYGEEKFAHSIAESIVNCRKQKRIKTTKELIEAIALGTPNSYQRNKRINFATKTFQALRIATNDELNNISQALPDALRLLKVGGRIAIISYHSLEDRIIKNYIKMESKDCLCPPISPVCHCHHKACIRNLTPKVLTPSREEVETNPRSRSARMRAAEKVNNT